MAEEARASAEALQREATGRVEELAASLARVERKAALLSKEREGLKAILASYDEEYLNHQGRLLQAQFTNPSVSLLQSQLYLRPGLVLRGGDASIRAN